VVSEQTPRKRSSQRSALRRAGLLQSRLPLLQLIALAAIFTYGATTLEGLATWPSIKFILFLGCLIALSAMGQTLLILMGGFDMSVAGFIALGTMVLIIPDKWNIPYLAAVAVLLAAAGIVGGCAGQICHRLDLNPLIVTLATGAMAAGASVVISGSSLLSGSPSTPDFMKRIASLNSGTLGTSIPPLLVITTVIVVLFALFLHRTVGGLRLLSTGANRPGAELSLVKTRRIWTASFAFSAMASVMVGTILGAFNGGLDLSIGDPYLFLGVTAVFVGGTVFGGPGDFTRTVIGALFLQVLTVVLVGKGLGPDDQQILYGVMLLVAVTIYGRGGRLRDRV
jgi:ribose transport system permease protein